MKEQYFDQIYANVPDEQKKELIRFRATHPYKELKINASSWRYIACGKGSKTLLFLPGAFMKADLWFQTIMTFEKDYRIIALDDYSLEGIFVMRDICQAYVEILDHECIQKAIVIGVSGGAGVAQIFLQEYSQRVDHIVFSHCGIVKPENVRRVQKQLKLIKYLPFPVLYRILSIISKNRRESPVNSEWVTFRNAYLREMGQLLNKNILLQFFEQAAIAHQEFQFDPIIVANFPGRILILSSKGDEWTHIQETELKKRYPNAETHIFREGGHHVILLFPKTYNSVLAKFLHELT